MDTVAFEAMVPENRPTIHVQNASRVEKEILKSCSCHVALEMVKSERSMKVTAMKTNQKEKCATQPL